ncbi:hypothetical protein FVB9288_00969 [Flavobacterium sp. CECT 9288]|uniref:hypothetical protein n=1 Tax=Flavobacterium sp. CECT 9288 TaxID=2845819 RepID=UPI001E4084EC|nr:hypothetical protein [Flavobacterium sp. CECT 9288]CAH0335333.1 hypothetical protein FVB9288_00969 [Flavobacterium sp. CECT 9288]
MKLKTLLLSILLLTTIFVFSQTNTIIVHPNINLPKDTIISNELIKSLNGFLSLKDKANNENSFVLKEDLLETSVLLDEMKGIEKGGKFKDDNFYKSYLTNLVPLKDSNFLVEFSYIGVNENSPIVVASFEVLAKLKDEKFYFLSPLKRNTFLWKTKTIEGVTFHYKSILNEKVAKDYVKKVTQFDKKLKSNSKTIEWYGFDDMNDMLKGIGVSYKLLYNSRTSSTFTAKENNSLLIASGTNNSDFNGFDPHDLWHERLYNVIPKSRVNKPVDEGCAYIYGGSWGISWEQILKTFKAKVSSNKSIDFLATYEDLYDFGESNEKHLLVPYVINALIIKKLEKEKGFVAVMELLSCGKYQNGNENYYTALDKLTGINKSNFNERVWKLINESGN